MRTEIFDPELEELANHPTRSKTQHKASIRIKSDRVSKRIMVELFANMQYKRRTNGIIDIEFAQNPLKTVFMTALQMS